MRRKLFVLALLTICTNCFAQEYPFVNYTPKDGLVNSRVRKAYQDSRGRMYFLTYGGLSVYDGARFKNYTAQNGLSINMVNDIIETGYDSLLVFVNSNQVHTLINGVMGVLKTADDSYPVINHVIKSEDGSIYAATDNGLFRYHQNKFERLPLNVLYLGWFIEYKDYLIFTTNDLKDFKGLYLYDKKKKIITENREDVKVYFLAKDQQRRVWASLSDKVVLLDTVALQNGTLKFTPVPASYAMLNRLPVVDMSFDQQSVWVNHNGNELIKISGKNTFRMQIPNLQSTVGMQSIFIDREKNVWVCNDGQGVFKFINPGLQIKKNLSREYIYTSSSFGDTTWCSTNQNILIRQTRWDTTSFICNVAMSPQILKQEGNKLLAANYKAFYEAEIPGNNTTSIRFIEKVSVPDSNSLSRIVSAPGSDIFISPLYPGKLSAWKNDKLLLELPLGRGIATPRTEVIEGMQFDHANRLWTASRSSGLTVYTVHPRTPAKYLQFSKWFKETELINPRSMVIDKDGNVWVGTRYSGLIGYKFTGNELKKLFHFTRNNGITDDFVTALACDSNNNIIVGTQTGLDRLIYNNGNYYIENITKNNNAFAYISYLWIDPDNTIHAICASGTLLHAPAATSYIKNHSPELFIEELKMNGNTIATNKNKFSHDNNNLSFILAAPTFIDEKQVQFSYKLEVGSTKGTWSDTTTNAVINLVNLGKGDYRLKVKAFFPSTGYAPQEISYAFRITPPWWQTWWFRVIGGMVIIGIAVMIVRLYYQRRLQIQQSALERQQAIEKERTRIATDMHDDLGAGLSRIKFLSETIGIKKQQQQPIEEDIGKIREYSHEMIDKMGEIVWALNEKNDSLSDLLAYTRSFAVEYLSQSGIDCEVQLPEQVPVHFISGEFRRNIFLSVKEILHNIVKHSQASKVDISISINEKIQIAVQDDGIGFNPQQTRPYSNGLTNIRKRMEYIGGSVEIVNKRGTLVKLTLPI